MMARTQIGSAIATLRFVPVSRSLDDLWFCRRGVKVDWELEKNHHLRSLGL